MPDTGGAAGSVAAAGGFTDLEQPSRESEGERLEIFGELDGRADQDVISRSLAVGRARLA